MRSLIRLSGKPLAAPSANPFARLSPTTAAHVEAGLGRKIRWILDGGPCSAGVESTIVDLIDPTAPRILRPGAIPQEAIEAVLRTPLRRTTKTQVNEKHVAHAAPGMFSKHYSPRARLVLHRWISKKQLASLHSREAAIVFSGKAAPQKKIWALSASGSLQEAARALFKVLHEADAAHVTTIHCELAPEKSLGHAINDRLRRAAAKR